MTINNNMLHLIKELISHRSCYDQEVDLLRFIADNPQFFCKEDLDDLLGFIRDRQKKQKQQGFDAIQKRKYKKPRKSKSYDKPMFVQDYQHGQICACCNVTITSLNAFRWKQDDGQYKDYHALPTCFPAGQKEIFEQNEKYIAFISQKTT